MTDSIEVQLARLQTSMELMVEEMRRAAEARRGVYDKLEGIGKDMVTVNHRLDTVERSVESLKPTTAELERVRDRVRFAGSLGQALWSVGKALLSAAAGAAAAWYTLTGRPPP